MKFITKTLLIVFALHLPLMASVDGGPEREEVCLEVLGIAVDGTNKPIDGVIVRLFLENEELEWSEITSVSYHEHWFKFKLEANKNYTIEISKTGFVTRSVAISTAIPASVSLEQVFKYEFEIELLKEKKGVDDFYLDFPVALISYDKKHEVFNYSTSYTRHIKGKIKETTGQINAIKTTHN
jgi:hypothetical protein